MPHRPGLELHRRERDPRADAFAYPHVPGSNRSPPCLLWQLPTSDRGATRGKGPMAMATPPIAPNGARLGENLVGIKGSLPPTVTLLGSYPLASPPQLAAGAGLQGYPSWWLPPNFAHRGPIPYLFVGRSLCARRTGR